MIRRLSAAAVALLLACGIAEARECGPDQFAKLVDDTGAKLREANASSEAEMRKKFQALAKAKGWPADDSIERGFTYLNDDQTRTLDAQAERVAHPARPSW